MDDIQRSKTAAGEHIVDFFKEHQDGSLIYHNQLHTQTVVLRAEEIGDYYGLSPLDSFIVFIAACFHDTGHLVHAAGGHEEKSVELMREYFKQENIEESILLQVETCILATRLPSDP
jgi:HD superfamily phosphodiesterase